MSMLDSGNTQECEAAVALLAPMVWLLRYSAKRRYNRHEGTKERHRTQRELRDPCWNYLKATLSSRATVTGSQLLPMHESLILF